MSTRALGQLDLVPIIGDANFDEFSACSDFDEFSACSDAKAVVGGVVRVSVIVAPRGILLVVDIDVFAFDESSVIQALPKGIDNICEAGSRGASDATAFAAHHARGSTLSPRDTTFRRGDTMVHRPTMLRARDTTTTTRSTQSLGDFSALTALTIRVPDRAGFSF
jgi:hypothetical protein